MDAVRSGQLIAASMRDESLKHVRFPPQVFLPEVYALLFQKST
jgi:hypothetical protein